MPYYAHHNYKGAHHNVDVDVLPDPSFDWRPYYTLHKYKGAYRYACVYVLSD